MAEVNHEARALARAINEAAKSWHPQVCLLGNITAAQLCRVAELLERQTLRPVPVSEKLPGPGDCLPWPDEPDETPWCWAFVKGPLGDDAWERRPVSCLTTYKPMHTHWLAARDLPLPEFE